MSYSTPNYRKWLDPHQASNNQINEAETDRRLIVPPNYRKWLDPHQVSNNQINEAERDRRPIVPPTTESG